MFILCVVTAAWVGVFAWQSFLTAVRYISIWPEEAARMQMDIGFEALMWLGGGLLGLIWVFRAAWRALK